MRRITLVLAIGLVLAVTSRASGQSAATQQLIAEADKAFENGDIHKAAAYYDRAIASEPKGVAPIAYSKRANIYALRKHYNDGLRWIEDTALKAWPNDPLVLEQKAVLLSYVGKKKEAIELAEKVTARQPKAYFAQLLLGDYFSQAGAGGAEKAAAAYEAYLANRPSDLESRDGLIRLKLGFALLYLERYGDAEEQFQTAERKFKSDGRIAANARKGLCAAYAGMGSQDNADAWTRAITICEQVIRDKAAMRGDPSPYFNIAKAYLAKGQYANAMSAANSYLQQKPNAYQGFLIRGQVYYKQSKYNEAETQFNRSAELASRGNAEVASWRGRTAAAKRNFKQAIDLLSQAVQANPDDVGLRMELGRAYLAAGQGTNAATQAEQAIKVAAAEPNRHPPLYALAGDGHYLAGDLSAARNAYDKAIAGAKANDQAVDRSWITGKVNTINRQAADKLRKNDLAGTEALLLEALDADRDSTVTNFNLGLVAIEKGQWANAVQFLNVRLRKQPNDLPTNRLIARAYLGAKNETKAAEHYAIAEAEAKKLRNLAVLAEVYTEWGPLLIQAGKIDDAVEKLEQAEQYSNNQPFANATRRNYQVALFRRGYERLRKGRGSEAVPDLEGALRFPNLLQGNEEEVFSFALGLAYLDAGQGGKASAIFQTLAKKGGTGWLKPPWDKVGADFFGAYALYREGSSASRSRAAGVFERLVGKTTGALGAKVRDLLRSSHEYLAYDAYVRGSGRDAEAALKKAETLGGGNRAAIDHNMAVLKMDKDGAAARTAFERLKERVPEALVNLGILADRAGDSKKAYELWTEARSRGVRSGKLDEWIAAKKRIFGF